MFPVLSSMLTLLPLDMGVSYDVTSPRHVLPLAACMLASSIYFFSTSNINFRFAFVEYESRRDADDAYHEMHNKRIGRDDLLKIEVGCSRLAAFSLFLTS
jgi:hypothetical protein